MGHHGVPDRWREASPFLHHRAGLARTPRRSASGCWATFWSGRTMSIAEERRRRDADAANRRWEGEVR